MPSLLPVIDAQAMKRFYFAFTLVFACTLPVVAQGPAEQAPANAEQAEAFVLPDNPSREQVEKYFNEVTSANTLSPENFVKKLEAVPDQHVDLLLNAMRDYGKMDPFSAAMGRRDLKVIKPIIIAGLDEHPNNIIAIRLHGWYDDAKEPILRKLEKREPLERMTFGNAWLHAFTHIAEPKHYAMVKQAFVSSGRRSHQALMLETMPGYDILDTIKACIAATNKNIADGNPAKRYIDQEYRELERLWVLAARVGDLDSLGILIDALNNPKGYSSFWRYRNNEMDIHRDYVTQFIDFKGSNKEIAEWFQANRDQLVFDNLTKRYVIAEDF